jgi:UDP-3-O-[3-hydroxymyristoyl] glucosamine N-acyltransferase
MLVRAHKMTVRAIAELVGGRVFGDANRVVEGIDALDAAGPGDVTFIAHSALLGRWAASRAGAVVSSAALGLRPTAEDDRPVIEVPDAEHAATLVLEVFLRPEAAPAPGVHSAAIVDPSAEIAADAAIGPLVTVGSEAVIGRGSVLHPGVHVAARCVIGAGCILHAGVVLREGVSLGDRVILHSGVVIGTDGFGYRPDPSGRGLRKVPHIGTVRLEDDVEIGANTCVDRGKFGATTIGAGTKIDNLCQIGHNCRIGRSCVIAGACSFAGSVVLGDGVMVGGSSGFADHVTVGAGSRVGARSGVLRDLPPGAEVLGLPAAPVKEALRQWAAVRKLPSILAKLRMEVVGRTPPDGSAASEHSR